MHHYNFRHTTLRMYWETIIRSKVPP